MCELCSKITHSEPAMPRWTVSAMAGVAYQLSTDWLIDVGYRYLSYGTAKSDYDFLRNRVLIRDLASHELRVGLRYAFD